MNSGSLMGLSEQMLVCLVIAAIIGFIIGYLLGRIIKCEKHEEVQEQKVPTTQHAEEEKAFTLEDEPAPLQPAIDKNKPDTLPWARNGQADNLKEIKGIGPKIEKTLNELGIYHFDQIASWTSKNAKWIDEFISFKGRVEREDWISQAEILARGEDTEFSERVKKGKVYNEKEKKDNDSSQSEKTVV
jgi:NADH-quinone oxidoreductase subunit E